MPNKKVIVLLLAIAVFSLPAYAGPSKEMIELQAQMQQLLKMQQSIDEKLGAVQENMKSLIQQTNEALARVSASVDRIDKSTAKESAASDSCVDQLTGQTQPLHDSLTELKASVAALNKQLNEMNAVKQGVPAPNAQPQADAANPR
jgi:uncharacterized protein involved in exopolysaccharide biosynthesis